MQKLFWSFLVCNVMMCATLTAGSNCGSPKSTGTVVIHSVNSPVASPAPLRLIITHPRCPRPASPRSGFLSLAEKCAIHALSNKQLDALTRPEQELYEKALRVQYDTKYHSYVFE